MFLASNSQQYDRLGTEGVGQRLASEATVLCRLWSKITPIPRRRLPAPLRHQCVLARQASAWMVPPGVFNCHSQYSISPQQVQVVDRRPESSFSRKLGSKRCYVLTNAAHNSGLVLRTRFVLEAQTKQIEPLPDAIWAPHGMSGEQQCTRNTRP